MFIAEVVNVVADEACVDEYGIIDYKKADLIGYAGGKYCKIGDVIGKMGMSKIKCNLKYTKRY